MPKRVVFYNNRGECTVNVRLAFQWLFKEGLCVKELGG